MYQDIHTANLVMSFRLWEAGYDKEQQEIRSSMQDADYFELIQETDYVTIPEIDTLRNYAIQRCEGISAEEYPFSITLKEGMKKKIKLFREKEDAPYSYEEVVQRFVEAQGAEMPNLLGLAVAEMLVDPQITMNRRIWSGKRTGGGTSFAYDGIWLPYEKWFRSTNIYGVPTHIYPAHSKTDSCFILLCD
jgi:hypothetical protein